MAGASGTGPVRRSQRSLHSEGAGSSRRELARDPAWEDSFTQEGADRAHFDDDDDDAREPLPSWFPASTSTIAARPPEPRSRRRERVLAWLMLVLGCIGMLLGFFLPGTYTEVVLGALLLVLGLRILIASTS